MTGRGIEIEAAEALLDVGVSLPLIVFKVPFSKKRISVIRVKIKRPYLGTLIRMSKLYVKIGVTYDEMSRFTPAQEAEFMASHGRGVAELVALGICRGRLSGKIFSGMLARMLLWNCDDRYIFGAGLLFRSLLSTRSFRNIIRSAQRTNPMKPRLSQKERES